METISEWGKNLRDFKGSLLLGSQLSRRIVEMEICSFQPHFISNFPRGEGLSVSLIHDPTSCFICS